MTGFGFPKQSIPQRTGRAGEAFFEYFVANVLGWIYRPVPQQSDFGVDGYIDVVKDENITGKSIAVQIKCGDSYISRRSKGGIKYEGNNKHLNYYLNLQIPVILIALSSDCSQAFWVSFDIERTTGTKSRWWLEIPKKNKLDVNVKDAFAKLAGNSRDYSEEIQRLWAMSEMLSSVGLFSFAIPKSEVSSGSLSTLDFMIKSLSKNKEMVLQKRMTANVFFPEYDSDSRELFQIPEVRRWFLRTMMQGIPWFYFLEQITDASLTLLYCCTCEVALQGVYKNKCGLLIDPDETDWWLTQNFTNLNKFVEINEIPGRINREISHGVGNWFERTFSGDASDFISP